MSETDTHPTPRENLVPFTGDRGWRGLARAEGEGATFAIVLALVLVIVLAALIGGLPAVGLLFVILTFVSIAALIVISMGG